MLDGEIEAEMEKVATSDYIAVRNLPVWFLIRRVLWLLGFFGVWKVVDLIIWVCHYGTIH